VKAYFWVKRQKVEEEGVKQLAELGSEPEVKQPGDVSSTPSLAAPLATTKDSPIPLGFGRGG